MIEKKRETELDLLRIIALLAVISVHATGVNTDNILMSDFSKQVLTWLDAIVTWQIPVYVMISGRFFLDPERNMDAKKIGKAIRRIVIAFLVWNPLYQIFYVLSGAYSELNWKGILMEILQGPYHFWYLFMIGGLYMIVPFLRLITENRKLMEYYLLLFVLFEGLSGYGTQLPGFGSAVSGILNSTGFHFAMGFAGYYVLGYFIYKYKDEVPEKIEFLIYGLAILALLIVSGMTVSRAITEGVNNEWYTGYRKPNTMLIAAAIFLFFEKRVGKHAFSQAAEKWIERFSANSFGVYLIHALVLDMIGLTGISSVYPTPFLMQPLLILVVFVVCNIIVEGIRCIPKVGRYII